MQLQIKKWGNSAAIRIPQAILAQFHIQENDRFDVEINEQFLVLRPVVKKEGYSLRQLMAEMPDGLPMVNEWNDMPDVGLEKI